MPLIIGGATIGTHVGGPLIALSTVTLTATQLLRADAKQILAILVDCPIGMFSLETWVRYVDVVAAAKRRPGASVEGSRSTSHS